MLQRRRFTSTASLLDRPENPLLGSSSIAPPQPDVGSVRCSATANIESLSRLWVDNTPVCFHGPLFGSSSIAPPQLDLGSIHCSTFANIESLSRLWVDDALQRVWGQERRHIISNKINIYYLEGPLTLLNRSLNNLARSPKRPGTRGTNIGDLLSVDPHYS